MKRISYLLMLMAVVLMSPLMGCSDDNDGPDDTPINSSELPTAAKTFVSQYYDGATILLAEKDYEAGGVEYDVTLSNGHKITFNSTGEWIDVDAPAGQTVPAAIVPTAIAEYVTSNYPQAGVNEISKETYGYDIELTTGIDLMFNAQGGFIGIDR